MKLSIERAALLKAMSHVQGVVERRNTIPILSNVLLEADGEHLRLTATDLDIEVREDIPASVAAAGATTAPAHMVYDIVRKLPEGAQINLSLDAEHQKLTLSAGRSRFQLACLPRDEFPALSIEELASSFRIPAGDLRKLIDGARFAISFEETRYYLNGIYLHPADSGGRPTLRSVATDGHRLSRIDVDLPVGAEETPGVICPRKTVNEVRKLIDDVDVDVTLAVSSAMMRVGVGGVTLTSKLIQGSFPDYQRVIPAGNDKRLLVDAKSFAEAVDRVSTVSSEKSRAVKVDIVGEKLVLSVTSPDAGFASEELEVAYGLEAMEVGFNARYLLDILQQIDDARACFDFAEAGAPIIVSAALPDGAPDRDMLFVLMPLRV